MFDEAGERNQLGHTLALLSEGGAGGSGYKLLPKSPQEPRLSQDLAKTAQQEPKSPRALDDGGDAFARGCRLGAFRSDVASSPAQQSVFTFVTSIPPSSCQSSPSCRDTEIVIWFSATRFNVGSATAHLAESRDPSCT